MYKTWSAPLAEGPASEEIALAFDQARAHRLIIFAPLFDEHNKMRRQIAEVMRRLDLRGIDCFLPDMPGCNESLAPLAEQTLGNWRVAGKAAAEHFGATCAFAIRGGALVCPSTLPTYAYAPAKGRALLNGLLRARTIAAKEAGLDETREGLLQEGRANGIELAGWRFGAEMIGQLEAAEPRLHDDTRIIEQADVGGAALWLRAEPDDDPEQADALAAFLSVGIMGA